MKKNFFQKTYFIDVILFGICSLVLLTSEINNMEKYIKVIAILIGIEAIIAIIRGVKTKRFYIVECIINVIFSILLYVDKSSSINNLSAIFVIWTFVISVYLLGNIFINEKERNLKIYNITLLILGFFILCDFIYIFGYKPHSLSLCLLVVAISQYYTGRKEK